MRNIIFTFSIGLLLGIGQPAFAEPGSVGKWLMATPASVWELGMFRLEQLFVGFKGPHLLADAFKGVYYNWDQNRIILLASFSEREFDKAVCGKALNAIRKGGGVNDGKVSTPLSYSAYAQSFQRGFATIGEPENYLSRLDNIIRAEIRMKGGSCEGRLVSTEILYKED